MSQYPLSARCFKEFNSETHRQIATGKKKTRSLGDEVRRRRAEKERKFAKLPRSAGAVLPEGPKRQRRPEELVAAWSALLKVCDHSEGRDLPPEVISFQR